MSMAHTVAFWAMEQVALVTWPCSLLAALAMTVGAAMKPIRQPVIAKPLATPLTVMTRSLTSGNWAIDSCLPTKLMCS